MLYEQNSDMSEAAQKMCKDSYDLWVEDNLRAQKKYERTLQRVTQLEAEKAAHLRENAARIDENAAIRIEIANLHNQIAACQRKIAARQREIAAQEDRNAQLHQNMARFESQ